LPQHRQFEINLDVSHDANPSLAATLILERACWEFEPF
jgi:hypothetical protein